MGHDILVTLLMIPIGRLGEETPSENPALLPAQYSRQTHGRTRTLRSRAGYPFHPCTGSGR